MHDAPTDSKTSSYVAYVLDYLALGFILAAVDTLAAARPWYVWVGCTVFGLLLGLLGFKWAQIRRVIGGQFASTIENTASSQRFRRVFLMLALLVIGSYLILKLRSLRDDLDTYAMPRVVTDRQAHDLQAYLSHHEAHSLTVKVNPLDEEAVEYANALVNRFAGANWDAKINTSSGEPNTLNSGLCVAVSGANLGPPDPKHDPAGLLRDALDSAHIEANCGSGTGAGEYRVFLLVGHRPRALGDQRPFLAKFGLWLQRLSSRWSQ